MSAPLPCPDELVCLQSVIYLLSHQHESSTGLVITLVVLVSCILGVLVISVCVCLLWRVAKVVRRPSYARDVEMADEWLVEPDHEPVVD